MHVIQALETIEKESEILRRKLSHQEKTKFQKTHARIQEKRSLKSMELARSTNIDKLVEYIFRLTHAYSVFIVNFSCVIVRFVDLRFGRTRESTSRNDM